MLPHIYFLSLLIASTVIAVTLSPAPSYTAYDPKYDQANYNQKVKIAEHDRIAANEKLIRAAETGDVNLAHEAINEKANINHINIYLRPNAYRKTPLMIAAGNGHAEVVRLLLKHNANINIQDDLCGNNALMRATQNGHVEIVRFLLKHHTNINTQDISRNTALILAAANNKIEVVYILLEYNANTNVLNLYGLTELACAVQKNNSTIVKILILHGATPIITCERAEKVFDEATSEMKKIIEKSMEQRAAMVQELDLQDWDTDTEHLSQILTDLMIPSLVDIVCTYANPYYTDEKPLYHAIQHYLQNNSKRARTQIPKPTSTTPVLTPTPTAEPEQASSMCYVQAPDCACSRNRKKICNSCAIA